MQEDVPAAVAFCEQQIQRILIGNTTVWDLTMTGGLWRVTGSDVAKAAAAAPGVPLSLKNDKDRVRKYNSGSLVQRGNSNIKSRE